MGSLNSDDHPGEGGGTQSGKIPETGIVPVTKKREDGPSNDNMYVCLHRRRSFGGLLTGGRTKRRDRGDEVGNCVKYEPKTEVVL